MTRPVTIRGFDTLLLAACLAASARGQVVGPTGAGVESLRLTRKQAIAEAWARNPGLIASQEQIEQARAQVVIAAAFPDPTFSADASGESHPLNPGSRTGSD